MTPYRCKHAVEAMRWDVCARCFGEGSYLRTERGRGGFVAFRIMRCTCLAGLLEGRARLDDEQNRSSAW